TGFGLFRIILVVSSITAVYSIVTIREISDIFGVEWRKVAFIFLVIFFILNAGILSAAVTHDRTRYPQLDQNWILEQGSDIQVYSLFFQYTSYTDLQASQFIVEYVGISKNIYGPVA
ncbi:MAG: hypothetical protein ABEI86_01340, partial [Halobacteriaceae archaeon]